MQTLLARMPFCPCRHSAENRKTAQERRIYSIFEGMELYQSRRGFVDVDTLHPPLISGQQCFEGFQIIPVDNHILAAVVPGVLAVLIKTILPVKYPEGHLLMVVDDLLFSNLFQCGHGLFLPIAIVAKDLSRMGRTKFSISKYLFQ